MQEYMLFVIFKPFYLLFEIDPSVLVLVEGCEDHVAHDLAVLWRKGEGKHV